jgi:hypothetical protein
MQTHSAQHGGNLLQLQYAELCTKNVPASKKVYIVVYCLGGVSTQWPPRGEGLSSPHQQHHNCQRERLEQTYFARASGELEWCGPAASALLKAAAASV